MTSTWRWPADTRRILDDAAMNAAAAHPGSPLRVLVVAHDFPPNPSPQSLRTARLVDGLRAAGHRVHVLSADVQMGAQRIAAPAETNDFRITRCTADAVDRAVRAMPLLRAIPGAWRHRFKQWVATLRYPGLSHGWLQAARPALARLLSEFHPDRVVISHEPAAGLLLRDAVNDAGIPWVAELGDPVCARYTPARWREAAMALEAATCREAAHLVVASDATRAQLQAAHAVPGVRVSVVPQGFDAHQTVPASSPKGMLRLVYTGRLYAFRDPRPLFEAVARVEGVELVIAGPPHAFSADARRAGDRVRSVGELPYADALALQGTADVLVNIANAQLPQVPGKAYEYFAWPRPILHLTHSADDAQAALLARVRRGWVVDNRADAIAASLHALAKQHREGLLAHDLDLSAAGVAAFAWPRLAARFARIVETLRDADATPPATPATGVA